MLGAGVGILRTQPPPDERALARLRLPGRGARRRRGRDGIAYPEFVRALDPTVPAHAALMHEAARRRRAARATPRSTASRPRGAAHFAIAAPYAHATAPLRRLQDRYVSECCLRVRGAPARLGPRGAARAAGDDGGRRRGARARSSAASSTSSRPCCSQGREGERFDAVVDRRRRRPAARARRARARLDGGCPRRAPRSPSASSAPTRRRARSPSRSAERADVGDAVAFHQLEQAGEDLLVRASGRGRRARCRAGRPWRPA